MDTAEKEVLYSKFSMITITTGKAISKIHETIENARNSLTFGFKMYFRSYAEYSDN